MQKLHPGYPIYECEICSKELNFEGLYCIECGEVLHTILKWARGRKRGERNRLNDALTKAGCELRLWKL